MSTLVVTGYHYFQAPRPHLCFVLFYHYYIFVAMTNQVTLALK